jgi:homoserine O-acetyltransferase/O-succinyltransferase
VTTLTPATSRLDDPHSVGLVSTQFVSLFEPPAPLELECGRTLGPVQVAYETYGTLSPQKDNVVLICHALTGDAHAAGWHRPDDKKPGWWDIMIGPGKGLDTNRYFVICSNILGGCSGTTGPSSINPATDRPWGLDFPVITVQDMVKVQKRLVEHLGIDRLLAVIGGSMGGMQVLEWAVRYPEMVLSAIPIATTPRLNAQSIAFDAVGRQAILADPTFAEGQYHGQPERGLSIARMVGHITYLSEQGMHEKFGRQLRHSEKYAYDFGHEFSVETYLDYQGRAFVERFDANSYLYITKAMDYYDLTARDGSLEAAVRDVRSRFLVVSFTSDWLFTPAQSRQLVDALLANEKDVSYCDIDSPYGHDAFLLEPEILGRLIGGFLAGTSGHPDILKRSGKSLDWPARLSSKSDRPRRDYERIAQLIRPGSSVLDLGCGRGSLLDRLVRQHGVDAMGVELNQDALIRCIERSLTAVEFDLERDLGSFVTQSWDYVILSRTLQTLRRPGEVIREMLRIGRYAIVSFPNFAYWRFLVHLVGYGRTPQSNGPQYAWHDSPNLRTLTVQDFEDFCRAEGFDILERVFLHQQGRRNVRWWTNLRAEEAIYMLQRR